MTHASLYILLRVERIGNAEFLTDLPGNLHQSESTCPTPGIGPVMGFLIHLGCDKPPVKAAGFGCLPDTGEIGRQA